MSKVNRQNLPVHPVVSATNKSKWRANGLGIYGACRKAMQNLMRQFLTWIDYLVTCAVVFTLFWQTFITVLKKLTKKSHFLEFCNRSEQRLFEFSRPKITHNNIFWVIFKALWFIQVEGRDDSRLFFKNKQCFHSEDDFFIMQKSKAFSTRLPKVPTKMAQSWPWKEQSWTIGIPWNS